MQILGSCSYILLLQIVHNCFILFFFGGYFVFAHTEFASAVALVVKIIFFDDGDTAFAQSSFSPVLFPPGYIRVGFYGVVSGLIDLFQTFPA